MSDFQNFPAVAAAIEDGISRSLHTGVQIYVSLNCKPVLNAALGDASPASVMTNAHLMPWRSAGKPVTALLTLKLFSEMGISLQTKISELLPETTGCGAATVFDILTHQAGFPQAETGWPQLDWDSSIRQILSLTVNHAEQRAAYHPQSSWFVLGEILRQLKRTATGALPSFTDLLTRELLEPLGLSCTFCGIPESLLLERPDLLPQLYDREKGQLTPSLYSTTPWMTQPSPGGNLRGPVQELGRFFELLLRQGRLENGTEFVPAHLVETMTRRHRIGLFDETLQHTVDFGLGVLCDSRQYGVETVPYGFGKFCSTRAFGHGGSQCSMAFCDPEAALVVVWSANGFCGEGQHQRRNRMLNEAVYADLKLSLQTSVA